MWQRNPQEREFLKNKSVCLVGCGSVGSVMAELFVRAGVGTLTLIDPDRLSEENLERHTLTRRDLGRPKVDALKHRLHEVTNCEIKTVSDTFTFAEGVDLIVSAVDSYRCESLSNAVSLQCCIPALYVGCYGAARAGEVVWVIPTVTPCYECFAAFRGREEIATDPRKYTDPTFDDSKIPGQPGLFAPIMMKAAFAFHVAFEVMTGEIGGSNVMIYNLAHSDYEPFSLTHVRVKKGWCL